MRIEVVRERCEGHGLCRERAPTIYGLDDEGYVTFEYEDRHVPADKEDAAIAGVGVCPMAALLVRADGRGVKPPSRVVIVGGGPAAALAGVALCDLGHDAGTL